MALCTDLFAAPIYISRDIGPNPGNRNSLSKSKATIRVPQDFETIQEAVEAANEDDIIVLSPGIYSLTETVFIDKPISLVSEFFFSENEADIDATVITSEDRLDPLVHFNVTASNSICQGITFRDSRKQLTLECEYMEVLNCKFYDNTSDALSVEGGGGYFEANYFENNGDEAFDADHSLNWVFNNNIIINPGDDGLEIRLHNDDFSERFHSISNNYIFGADEDGIQLIDFDGDSGREFVIQNNIILNSAMVGIGCTQDGNTIENFEGSEMEEEVFVHNNIFENNDYGITGGNNMLVFNNIFLSSPSVAIKKLDNNSGSDYNCFFENGVDFENALNGDNNIFLDPMVELDFSLEENSPCIDLGTETYTVNALSHTIENITVFGNGPDIGAKEFGSGSETVNLAPSVLLGEDQVLLAPTNMLILGAEVSDDGLPAEMELSFNWVLESGPEGGEVVFGDAESETSSITFSRQGVYRIKFTADDGEKNSSDIITIVFANDFKDKLEELSGSTFIEAEDYRFLFGSATVLNVAAASQGQIINAPLGAGSYAYSEYLITTLNSGTYYVWVNATSSSEGNNTLAVSFNDLQSRVMAETGISNSFGNESWIRFSFDSIPEGAYPLRIFGVDEGVSWDRIFITVNEEETPYKVNTDTVMIYPVPSTGKFTIALKDKSETTIGVFSSQGRLIHEFKVSDKLFFSLNLEQYSKGTYFVSIKNNKEKIAKKVVVR